MQHLNLQSRSDSLMVVDIRGHANESEKRQDVSFVNDESKHQNENHQLHLGHVSLLKTWCLSSLKHATVIPMRLRVPE